MKGGDDDEGVTDEAETAQGSDVWSPDSDGDGLSDGSESLRGTDPLRADTDGDGFSDQEEIELGVSPIDANSVPEDVILVAEPLCDGARVFRACRSITASDSFRVAPDCDTTFVAGELIQLGVGFEVEDGGSFTATTDPFLVCPEGAGP